MSECPICHGPCMEEARVAAERLPLRDSGPRHVRVGETTWPVDGEPSVQWKLRYGTEPSREERLFAASVMSAYAHLTDPTVSQRAAFAALKRARQATAAAHRDWTEDSHQ